MAGPALIPSGDFRTTYAADTTIFPTTTSRNFAIAGIILLCFAPQLFSAYWLSISIQIGIFAIAALGLNILVGFTGQISIGHAAFFLLGACDRQPVLDLRPHLPRRPAIFLRGAGLPVDQLHPGDQSDAHARRPRA